MNSRFYHEYVKQFESALEYSKKHNVPFYWDNKFSKIEFETRYIAYKNENPELTKNEIVKKIVNEQRYVNSEARAFKIREAAERMGINMSRREASIWGEEVELKNAPEHVQKFWNTIISRRKELKAEGKDPETVAHLIAVEFFGSPD